MIIRFHRKVNKYLRKLSKFKGIFSFDKKKQNVKARLLKFCQAKLVQTREKRKENWSLMI
jgi:hypothetical protein